MKAPGTPLCGLALLGIMASCSDPPTPADGDSTGTETATTSSTTGVDATTSTTSTGDSADGTTETGTPEDLPPADPRPQLPSPAEAEDLDPDPSVVRVALTAAPHRYQVGDETVEGWAYNEQVPGPTIRIQRGQTLVVEFENGLDADTTIHWHGLHVPFEMDGVTWQGAAVQPGETFTYTFQIDQAGTYWYHPHVDTDRQVDLGLYGVIVVEDPIEPATDRELVVVFDSWGEHAHDSAEDHDHGGLDGTSIEWTANGLRDPVFPATAGERVRVRAVNATNAGYLELSWPQMRHIASDQGLLSALAQPDSVVLAPGDRMDGEWLVGEGFDVITRPFSLLGEPAVGEDVRLFEVTVDEPGDPPPGLPYPFDGALPTPDPGFTDVLYAFHGDPHTGNWTINGELFPDVTIEQLVPDSWSVIELRNISQSAHPFHLHGHAFEVLSVDGVTPAVRRLEDALDVAPFSIARVGLLPDNPGDWMAHCHILPHVDGGMMTVLRVAPP